MTDMPTTYETTTTQESGTIIRAHPEYLRTIPGILKIVECALSIITFICAIIDPWAGIGGGWVQFVSMSAFLTVLILFCGYFFGFYYRLPSFRTLVILSLLIFIFTFASDNWGDGQSWTQFASITAFLTIFTALVLHVLNFITRLPGPWLLIELIMYAVFTLFFLIAGIVAAARGWLGNAIAASAFFAFAATAVFAVDTFFQYRAFRSGQTEMATNTATTTTTTTVETKSAY